jgi:hypothetical protein
MGRSFLPLRLSTATMIRLRSASKVGAASDRVSRWLPWEMKPRPGWKVSDTRRPG